MDFLENRIPPPVVGIVVGAINYGLAQLFTGLSWSEQPQFILGTIVGLFGLGINASGFLSFRAAKTTVNPLKPETASSLVRSGIFAYTRNPMYVGMAIILVGWGIYLANPVAVLGAGLFVVFIQRFQITPEERAMVKLFGEEYEQYRQQTRRWL